MPANTTAIYSRLADIQWIATGAISSAQANNSTNINAGTTFLIFAADATNGGRVEKIVVMPLNSTTNLDNVMRLFVNNGSASTAVANNIQIRDIFLPTSAPATTKAAGALEIPLNIALPAGYTLYATFATSALAGFHVVAVGGKY